MKYKIFFTKIPASQIFNLTDPGLLPEVAFMVGPSWWMDEFNELRDDIRDMYISQMEAKTSHYSSLKKSVNEKGFLNPIIVTRGALQYRKPLELPPVLRKHPNLLTVEYLGGSRLALAKEMEVMDMPCIINDFSGGFEDGELLITEKHIKDKFVDDVRVSITTKGVMINLDKFIHIDDENYTMDTQIQRRHIVVQNVKQYAKNWLTTRGKPVYEYKPPIKPRNRKLRPRKIEEHIAIIDNRTALLKQHKQLLKQKTTQHQLKPRRIWP